jgi:hypothetical protein
MTFSSQPPVPDDSSGSAVPTLPESIREHRNLVNLWDWIKTRNPARYSFNARVRRRLEIEAA